jgi:hypothetical protein
MTFVLRWPSPIAQRHVPEIASHKVVPNEFVQKPVLSPVDLWHRDLPPSSSTRRRGWQFQTNREGSHFGYHALACDWIDDALTPEQRVRYGAALWSRPKAARATMTPIRRTRLGRAPGYCASLSVFVTARFWTFTSFLPLKSIPCSRRTASNRCSLGSPFVATIRWAAR